MKEKGQTQQKKQKKKKQIAKRFINPQTIVTHSSLGGATSQKTNIIIMVF